MSQLNQTQRLLEVRNKLRTPAPIKKPAQSQQSVFPNYDPNVDYWALAFAKPFTDF